MGGRREGATEFGGAAREAARALRRARTCTVPAHAPRARQRSARVACPSARRARPCDVAARI
eukprot:7836564-Lingulodinium_polyedra.AAC.1